MAWPATSAPLPALEASDGTKRLVHLCVFVRAWECVGETDYMHVGWGVSVVCCGARVQVNIRTVLAGKALVVGVPDPRIMPWSQKPHFLQVK
jgi:hypothetical protein